MRRQALRYAKARFTIPAEFDVATREATRFAFLLHHQNYSEEETK